MSNRRRLRAPDRSNSRIRAEAELAQHLGIAPHRLRESATATLDRPAATSAPEATPHTAAESIRIVEASTGTVTSVGGRRYRARLIEGNRWGSSGYYSQKLLETYGPAAWPIGTQMYLDHPTAIEEAERPERSVRDLAARIVTTPVYEADGLYSVIESYPHADPLIESLGSAVGLSIRANGTASPGTVAGRTGMVVESLVPSRLNSVDFVTVAGAGGQIVSLAEAARASGVKVREARNIEAWFEARLHTDFTQIADGMYGDGRLTREERITLSSAVGDALAAFTARLQADAPQLASRDPYDDLPAAGDDTTMTEARRLHEATAEELRQALCNAVTAAYGDDGPNGYVWVRDYDPDKGVVWYDAPDEGAPQTWQQGFTAAGTPAEVSLADTRTEVIARTVYDPAPPDAEDAAEPAGADAPGIEEAAREVVEAATPDPTDGAPPTASTPTEGDAGMSGTQQAGNAPAVAGTTATAPAAAAAVTDTTSTGPADAALTESNRRLAEAEARAAEAEQRLARADAVAAARPIATSILAESQLPQTARDRVLAQVIESVPLTAANALDEAAFRTAVTEAATEMENFVAGLREGAGEGQVAGLGTSAGASSADVTATRTKLAERYVARGMSPDAAKIAAAGRP